MKKFLKYALIGLIVTVCISFGLHHFGGLDIGHTLKCGALAGTHFAAISLVDISYNQGSNNTGGVQQEIFWALFSDIAFFPPLIQPDPTGNGAITDLCTINENFIMNSGKRFQSMYVTLEKGRIKSQLQGELDCKSFMNEANFFLPGTSPLALGFATLAKNGSFVFLIPEVDGQLRVLGTKGYPAKLKAADTDTGEKTADPKGTPFTFQSAGSTPSPIYTGQVISDLYPAAGSGYGPETLQYYSE